MSQLTNTARKLTNSLQQHVWCIIICACIIVLSILVIAFGGGDEKVGYASFAGALISIVLAVIVIIYMFFQHSESQRNIANMDENIKEMRHLINEASNIMAEKAESMEKSSRDFAQLLVSSKQDSSIAPTQKDTTLQFNPSVLPHLGALFLYSLVKAYKLQKVISLLAISQIIHRCVSYSNKKESDVVNTFGFGIGLILCLKCFTKKENILIEHLLEDAKVEVKKLPTGHDQRILEDVKRRTINPEDKEFIGDTLQKLDVYFKALSVSN